jgi:hypothetical protein
MLSQFFGLLRGLPLVMSQFAATGPISKGDSSSGGTAIFQIDFIQHLIRFHFYPTY